MTEKIIYAKYIGKDIYFVAGVPACDLTKAEWEALTEDQRKLALASGTHQLTNAKSGAKAAEVNHGSES